MTTILTEKFRDLLAAWVGLCRRQAWAVVFLSFLSAAGAIVDAISSAAAAVVTVGGDNSLSVAAAGDIAVRIALASSISA